MKVNIKHMATSRSRVKQQEWISQRVRTSPNLGLVLGDIKTYG